MLVTLPDVATIYVVPVPCAVAKPVLPIVATFVFEELHVTESVMSTRVPSSKVPIASYCWVEVMVESVGVIVIELRFATVTVTLVEPLIVADVAVTLAFPGSVPLINPMDETVNTAELLDDQLTEPVMFLVLPSSYVPVAVICNVLSVLVDGVTGVTVTLFKVGSTKNPLQLDKPMIATRSESNRNLEQEMRALGKKPPLCSGMSKRGEA